MRKVDYLTLASIIRGQYEHAAKAETSDDGRMAYWQGQRIVCDAIAREFAERASVDRAAFLQACGIG